MSNKFNVLKIDSYQTYDWLTHKHYAKRIPSISFSFGLYDENNILQGCLTIGKPASPNVCKGICGEEERDNVYELNRLIVNDGLPKNTLSYFVSQCLKMIPPMILISYSDSGQGHHGYIYQATNWIYLGIGKPRTHISAGDGKHPRHYKSDFTNRVEWHPKHRYLYLVGSKKQKKHWSKCIKYKICSYPKGENKRYDATYTPNTQGRLF